MPFAKSRLLGAILVGIAVLVSAVTFYSLWNALRLGERVTTIAVILNFAPSAILLLAGVTIIAKPLRTLIAFWIAPLWVPLLIGGLVTIHPISRYPGIAIVVALALAYSGALVFGIPAFLFLRARNWTSLRTATLVGGVMGPFAAYFGLVLVLLATGPGVWSGLRHLRILLVSAVLGIIVSTTFWAVARPDRPAA